MSGNFSNTKAWQRQVLTQTTSVPATSTLRVVAGAAAFIIDAVSDSVFQIKDAWLEIAESPAAADITLLDAVMNVAITWASGTSGTDHFTFGMTASRLIPASADGIILATLNAGIDVERQSIDVGPNGVTLASSYSINADAIVSNANAAAQNVVVTFGFWWRSIPLV